MLKRKGALRVVNFAALPVSFTEAPKEDIPDSAGRGILHNRFQKSLESSVEGTAIALPSFAMEDLWISSEEDMLD